MEEHGDDDKVLSYGDVVLRRSDLDILSGPNFLNDRIIEFYFSYLSSTLNDESVLLVPPSITQWIKECRGSIEGFVKPLNFPRKKLILFPVNDNSDVTCAEGGSHWILLVFFRRDNVFVNHDSADSRKAQFGSFRVCMALRQYTSKYAGFVECPSAPKQENGYDCGVYVVAVAKAVCEWFEKESGKDLVKKPEPKRKQIGLKDDQALWFHDLDRITPSAVSLMRTQILDLIKALMPS